MAAADFEGHLTNCATGGASAVPVFGERNQELGPRDRGRAAQNGRTTAAAATGTEYPPPRRRRSRRPGGGILHAF